jgi:hypothetical protein
VERWGWDIQKGYIRTADIMPILGYIRIADIPMLYAIRKHVFGKGDREFMTLLPSFDGKEILTGKEIQTSRYYLITGVKLLTSLDLNFFLFWKAGTLLNIRSDKNYNKRNVEV